MKTCSICETELPLEAFDTQSTGKLGKRADCKKCRKRFIRSKVGVVKAIHSAQIAKSRKRNHPAPSYTETDLFNWFWQQPNANALYAAWIASEYSTDLHPSVDRLDDYLPYTLSNIQLVTWKENLSKFYKDMQEGVNTKRCIAVDQYELDDTFVKTHHSYSAAAKAVNGLTSNIRNVAEQLAIRKVEKDGSIRYWTPKKSYGYIWKKH